MPTVGTESDQSGRSGADLPGLRWRAFSPVFSDLTPMGSLPQRRGRFISDRPLEG
jgi:hypothetical protein